MAYTILRFKKDKGGAVAGCERHNERKKDAYKSNPDIDVNKSQYNYHTVQAPQYTYSRKIKELIKKYGCKVRKDSVKLVETLITATPEFMNRLSEKEKKEYFERATEFMKQEIGADRIISAVVHMDEATPHMNLAFCPINKDGKLSAKSILGNQKSLSQWQTKFYECMHERWKELERGKSAQETKRKHIPTWLFKMADNLDYLYNQLLKSIENINMIGMKKHKEETVNLLSEFVPKARKFSAKVNSYKDYIEELEERLSIQKENNSQLRNENKQLKDKIIDDEKIIIQVPNDCEQEFNIHTSSGDIAAPNLENNVINLESSSGKIECGNINNGNFKSSSGDITVGNGNEITIQTSSGSIKAGDFNKLSAEASSGDVEVGKVGESTIKTSSGKMLVESAKRLQAEASSGEMDINTIEEYCNLITSSGSIEIDSLNITENSNINAKSGDVDIMSKNDIYIETETDSGDADVTNNNRMSEIVLKITTTSGSIKVD